MIARKGDGARYLALGHRFIDHQSEPATLAIAEPTNPRRQTRELDMVSRLLDPRHDRVVRRERAQDHFVNGVDVLRLARHRDPAEWPDALAEQRTDIEVDEGMHLESILDARRLRLGAEAVAVLESNRAAIEKVQHRAKVGRNRAPCQRDQFLRVALAHGAHLFERKPGRHVPVERIGEGLVRHDIGYDSPLGDCGKHSGRVCPQSER